MERLTKRDVEGRALLTDYGKQVYCSTQATADCVAKLEEKLATYEDTGLEPEEISNIIKGCSGIDRQNWMVTLFGKPLSEWYEIAKAEEHGLLIRLPCKVGACAYYINPFDEIEKGKITMIQQKADGTWKFRFSTSFSHDVTKDDLGKTVFFTREEAEKALEGMK